MSDHMQNEDHFEQLLCQLAEGSIDPVGMKTLETYLLDHPDRQKYYLEHMRLNSALNKLGQGHEDAPELSTIPRQPKKFYGLSVLAMSGYVLACLLLIGFFLIRQPVGEEFVAVHPDLSAAKIVAGRHAVFHDAPSSKLIGSQLQLGKDYVLQAGMAKLVFPSGAEAIVNAPAVFQIANDNELIINLGNCSVYAPDGAEGFRVMTPTGRIIDLGTRFSVVVAEDGASDVAVVDGEAEVTDLNGEQTQTLTAGEIVQLDTDLQLKAITEKTSEENYVREIPDHVISYSATTDATDRAVELSTLNVQRGGVARTYDRGDFILGSVNHHVSKNMSGVVPADSPRDTYNHFGPMNLAFISGFINPGGQKKHHQGQLVLGRNGTQGMNVVFDKPVVNSAGPDIIFFDLQVVTHPPEGDPFHLYPRTQISGARPITVTEYDIDGRSDYAMTISGFRLTPLSNSFADDGSPLPIIERSQVVHKIPCRAHAVGIDLDDMGIPAGESVTGLFIQDAADDENFVDPVVIVGLPPVK
ncbi:FecR family protein [Calycomorphotria hydatis]|uniref:FecR protein n=1 Tax=Calycomorphotria hydatis TaxID=2528027 RepID=A0A517TD56_9PLAN|nr:FecR family protein [Calycomorphotria hydatis]QDT66310.1 FecR protein [Calycomorphotria hydatis]